MKRVFSVFVMVLSLFILACENNSSDEREIKIGNNQDLRAIRPKKPVKVQLKRNAKGTYSWDIKGDDVEEIIAVDKRLREAIHTKQ